MLATRTIGMLRDRDPRAKMIEKLEEELRRPPWGIVLDSSLTGIDRWQPLKAMAGIKVWGPDYLLMVYDRSGQYTSGKVLVPDAYLEDKVQGKISLVCGVGPLCKGPEYEDWFGNDPPKVGDFVMTSIRDGITFLVGGIVFKLVEWKYLRLCTVHPDMVM